MVTPLTANGRVPSARFSVGRIAIAALTVGLAAGVAHAAPPKIRTDAGNTVPRCVTPKRLMAFIKTRNSNLDPRFADIAATYKRHGEIWRVRWDYAFFQMAVETNFLTYRTGNGRWGDVNPKQNNFAGLGTTGGGVPGDSYPDVNTGVLAQIQHLVVYSGERIDEPVGARTRLKQDDILVTMASKKGRTTFADLARRWAADKHYGASIEWVANNFRQQFCNGADRAENTEPAPADPVKRVAVVKNLAPTANLGGPAEADGEPARDQLGSRAHDLGGCRCGPRGERRCRASVRSGCRIEVCGGGDAGAQAARSRRAGGHRADHSDRRRAASRSGCDCGPGSGAGNGERRVKPLRR